MSKQKTEGGLSRSLLSSCLLAHRPDNARWQALALARTTYANNVRMVQLLQELDFTQGGHVEPILHLADLDLLDSDWCELSLCPSFAASTLTLPPRRLLRTFRSAPFLTLERTLVHIGECSFSDLDTLLPSLGAGLVFLRREIHGAWDRGWVKVKDSVMVKARMTSTSH